MGARRWSAVAKKVVGRTGQQCAQRWRHKVRPAYAQNSMLVSCTGLAQRSFTRDSGLKVSKH